MFPSWAIHIACLFGMVGSFLLKFQKLCIPMEYSHLVYDINCILDAMQGTMGHLAWLLMHPSFDPATPRGNGLDHAELVNQQFPAILLVIQQINKQTLSFKVIGFLFMYLLLLLEAFIYLQTTVNMYLNVFSFTKQPKHVIFLSSVSVIFSSSFISCIFVHPLP